MILDSNFSVKNAISAMRSNFLFKKFADDSKSSKINKNGIHDLIIDKFPFLINKKISQIIYHFKNKIYFEVKCFCCENSVRYIDINNGYVKYCSNRCQSKYFWKNASSEKISSRSEKSKETCLIKYGVENYTKTNEYKIKSTQTNIEKYGETHHLKTESSKNKIRESIREKYGVDNISQLESIKLKKKLKSKSKTQEEKLEIRRKYEETCLERYGVSHLSQDSDFLEEILKKSFSFKSYRLPSGKVISLQGYEPEAMNYLLKNYSESDLITKNSEIESNIGRIFYYDINQKKHRYFPDIYIKSENLVIEVKSDFTYNLNIQINQIKKNAILNSDINFNFIIIFSFFILI